MRAKTINFDRSGSPKDKIGIGLGEKALDFLRWARDDYQFDPSHEGYMGYLNIGMDMIDDEELQEGFRQFLKGWKRYLGIMKEMGLYLLEPPDEDETVFYDEVEISGLKAIAPYPNPVSESVRFERGKDPKDAMDIGQKALLKKRAAEIEWDWDPERGTEEIIDIVDHRGFNIKVAKLENYGSKYNLSGPDGIYYAVSDTGEPYINEPQFYPDPESALKGEIESLDDYIDNN
jgi:hypothetical protein